MFGVTEVLDCVFLSFSRLMLLIVRVRMYFNRIKVHFKSFFLVQWTGGSFGLFKVFRYISH